MALLIILVLTLTPVTAPATPVLWLPTPSGEQWQIIQGYACGTHDGWDRYSIDLIHSDGDTRGAPVRAAADGIVFEWIEGSGTLLVKHGEGFYTMYTHMERTTTARNAGVTRGSVIGFVGDRGARGNPHLHFTAFRSAGYPMQSPQSIPLQFADGYTLPEVGGCNQHGGMKLTASGELTARPPAYVAYLPEIGTAAGKRPATIRRTPICSNHRYNQALGCIF